MFYVHLSAQNFDVIKTIFKKYLPKHSCTVSGKNTNFGNLLVHVTF